MSPRLLSIWLEHSLFLIFCSGKQWGVFGSLVNLSWSPHHWATASKRLTSTSSNLITPTSRWLVRPKFCLCNSKDGPRYHTDSRWRLSCVEGGRSQADQHSINRRSGICWCSASAGQHSGDLGCCVSIQGGWGAAAGAAMGAPLHHCSLHLSLCQGCVFIYFFSPAGGTRVQWQVMNHRRLGTKQSLSHDESFFWKRQVPVRHEEANGD